MRSSAFGSTRIADNLTGLVSDNFLVTDVEHAAQTVPFRFRERDFHSDDFYDWPVEKKLAMSVLVMQKFRQWFEQESKPIDRATLAVVALTDTWQFIDHIIEEATEQILKAHQIKMIDHDESFCFITDYKAATDPFTISNALNSFVLLPHWNTLFEDQCRRILEAPLMSLQDIKFWTHRQEMERKSIEYRIRHNPFRRCGYSMKQGRKLMAHSYYYFASFFGEQAAREFIRGTPIKIRGHYFTWELELEPSSFIHNTINPAEGHVPYYLTLCDHEGQHLAEGCVVFGNFPVLDQAVLLGTWASTPQGELDLIGMTNFSNLTEAGIKHDNGIILGFPNVVLPQQLRSPQQIAELRRAAHNFPWEIDVVEPEVFVRECRIGDEYDWGESEDDDPFSIERHWDREISRCMYAYQRVQLERSQEDDLEAAPLIQQIARAERGEQFDAMNTAINAFRSMRRGRERTRRRLMTNPVSRALREELYRRLDVRPDVLAYMGDPECDWFMLNRFWMAPRLEGFISRKEPLDS